MAAQSTFLERQICRPYLWVTEHFGWQLKGMGVREFPGIKSVWFTSFLVDRVYHNQAKKQLVDLETIIPCFYDSTLCILKLG